MSRADWCRCDGSPLLCAWCQSLSDRAADSARQTPGPGETRAWARREGEAMEEQEPEKDFMARVIALAKTHSWEHYHTHRSDRSPAGFPDLVLVRETVLWIETKTNTGKLTMAQQRWLSLLANADQEVVVWRPGMWNEIAARLSREATP